MYNALYYYINLYYIIDIIYYLIIIKCIICFSSLRKCRILTNCKKQQLFQKIKQKNFTDFHLEIHN